LSLVTTKPSSSSVVIYHPMMLRVLRSGAKEVGRFTTRPVAFGRFVVGLSSPPPPPEEDSPEKIVATMEAHRKEAMDVWVTPAHVRAAPEGLCPPADVDVATLDGMPEPQRARTVTISQFAKSAMTSGLGRTKPWHVSWPYDEKWSNPLMGWTSSADPMHNTDLQFDTKDQAIAFVERRGWSYEVKAPVERFDDFGQNKYAFNFLPKMYENELKALGKKSKIFTRPRANKSHYFRPLKYHGDDEVPQHGLNPDAPWKY